METYKEKNFLTAAEVAEILRIGKSKCYEFLHDTDCPFSVVRMGKVVRVPSNSFYKWYDSLIENNVKGKRGR